MEMRELLSVMVAGCIYPAPQPEAQGNISSGDRDGKRMKEYTTYCAF